MGQNLAQFINPLNILLNFGSCMNTNQILLHSRHSFVVNIETFHILSNPLQLLVATLILQFWFNMAVD